jgi:cysteine desulfurase/selenocysteine lyase
MTDKQTDIANGAKLDVYRVRADFPVLNVEHNGHPIAYLDNAATSQKPQAVIDALQHYYATQNANVHRGVHRLSQVATDAYENARYKLKHFLNSALTCQLIYTRGATEGINLVAQTYGRQHVGEGDEVLISAMEHHSNIVPWQMLCEEKGAHLRVIPIDDNGDILIDEYKNLLTDRTKIVGLVHVSNALGTVNPAKELIALAHDAGAVVLLDGAQSTPHMPVDVLDLNCDFFVLSAHKMYGPTGIGALYGRADLLESMPPWHGGGDMILSVSFEKTTYNSLPYKFEAGTPNIADAIGLGATIDYLTDLGLDKVATHEAELLAYGTNVLNDIEGVKLVGTAKHKAGVLSFTMDNAHPHDIGQILDDEGIAIRAGHHCAQPVMKRFGVPATARASLGLYNTREELDRLGDALRKVNEVFG